ncbi:beta-ketoacyl-ACP synthase II [Planctomicrobium sp. SH527]|uniref:beta-ketoacyl-ACP synthase II n=1 Tax=Planctomicrobium sp. SH527 TaxID=3448123 RepID=UPI003F5C89BA
MRRRVVVTGMGCITPLGNDIPSLWQSLTTGRSGVDMITLFDASSFPTRIAAEVKGFDFNSIIENPERFEYSGRNIQFAIGAGLQAMNDSGLTDGEFDPTRFGVYLGAGEGQQDFYLFMRLLADAQRDGDFDMDRFTREGLNQMNPRRELDQEPNMPAGHLASLFNAQGPNLNSLTACAASSQAIGEATEIIRQGEADIMLSGGSHSMIHPFGLTGFNLLTALSTQNESPQTASRPFDRDRDGFVLGEGAAMLILEELEHAKQRGATIYGEIAGYGSTADAYRITDIHPDGRGATSCIQMALNDARCTVNDIHYVNAHGTSTPVNDRVETLALKKIFKEQAYSIPVSSSKSMMGHLIAAAGSAEAIVSLLAMKHGVIPPTINYTHSDADCDLDYVPNEARESTVEVALSNSFGFGGQNITLIFKRFKG